jgi:hypothetical protein
MHVLKPRSFLPNRTQIKVRQPIGRQDSMKTVIQTSRKLDLFLHEAAQNFELLSNIQDPNHKINKPTAVDVLFKAYPMVPLSCRSNLAGWYLQYFICLAGIILTIVHSMALGYSAMIIIIGEY